MVSPMNGMEPAPDRAGLFGTTHWSAVLAAREPGGSPQAAVALERLCRTYWYPLYAHVRRRGYSPEDAKDLTQEFFARLLARQWLSAADRSRGRFRSFLLTALNHFLANEWDRARSLKRGGGQAHVPLDTDGCERRYAQETSPDLNAQELYERNWALRFLEQVRTRLRDEYVARGKAERFDVLERFLPGADNPLGYAEAARQLRIPEGTCKSDVYRLKRRYAEVIREEIAHTVASPDEIDDELRHLIEVLGR